MMFAPDDLFDLRSFEHRALFDGLKYAWEALPRIESYIRSVIRPGIHGEVMPHVTLVGDVFIGGGTVVEPGAFICGPTIIGKNCQVRQNAYIRGSVLVGDNCVIGHSTEVKNSVFMDALSNFKITVDKTIKIKVGDEVFDTGLIKFGAILGDGVQTGCNAVLNPGTLIGRRSQVYACSLVRGFVPPDTIVKLRQKFDLAKLS